MRERINRLARGIIDSEAPQVVITPEQVEVMKDDPERWMKFACYLNEQEAPPRTQEELLGRSRLRDFINHNLELIDDEGEEEVLTREDYEEIQHKLASY